MRAASIVMIRPLTKNSPQMRCIERNNIVQAFAIPASGTHPQASLSRKPVIRKRALAWGTMSPSTFDRHYLAARNSAIISLNSSGCSIPTKVAYKSELIM